MPDMLMRPTAVIHYWALGDPHAPTVVCTHGATLDRGAFAQQVPALLDAGYRVVTWDMRGHGASQQASGPLTIGDAAEDLCALLTETGAGPVVLLGQSFGGLVVQELYRQRPSRVAALVLAGSPALADRAPWHQRMLNRTRPFLLRLWPERHLRRVLPSFMSRRADVRGYVARATEPVSKATLVAVTRAALDGLLTAAGPRASTVPVLVVHGSREQRFVVRMIRAWAARDRHVDVAAIPGAGHLVNQDDPAAFNEALLQFLRHHVPTTPSPEGGRQGLRTACEPPADARVRTSGSQTGGPSPLSTEAARPHDGCSGRFEEGERRGSVRPRGRPPPPAAEVVMAPPLPTVETPRAPPRTGRSAGDRVGGCLRSRWQLWSG